MKLTFAMGASLADPSRLLNSGRDGNVRRAVDINEGEEVDAGAFKELVRAAVTLNASDGRQSLEKRSRRVKLAPLALQRFVQQEEGSDK